ncbi:bifunctional demethylmenaquinone methyltransferase/2-methoxy-6-polyprenyl-1,4-benzoquinol methylase UbiE [Ignavibacteria bacterium]|jgi:demethylmenaquinone methyltransferase/2-methoxy-6-polyprenyl-1,4-benzoquinol methylase|nr:bifunctional demethylmenaquinone methyltransferase/2-methoxy-6-polyprenyl-1,4-benzoquinol methylase UbiE [Bacteroidota bacterium]MCZ2132940.1 bifunctional demethylmenaquinone methyltransferase/2-methoxy-6-polyprenyl-1,4-benzoquinol methylase UbiE [Bacteroidota bacterium]
MSEEVRQMFAEIAPRYDIANSTLSLGTHRRWRKRAVRLSEAGNGMSVLDCATGTGDLAMEFKRAVGADGNVTGTDFCKEMMQTAPQKAAAAGLDIHYETADVTALRYPDNSFDITSISFGIRNVDDPSQALREMARTTRPGGKVVVIEFGQPQGLFGALYNLYSRYIIPTVGGALSGKKSAYSYLARTSAQFPAGEKFLALMRETKVFSSVSATPLTFGVAFTYIGIKKR